MSATHSIQFSNRFTAILKIISFSLIAVYLLNCFTPLRLHVDTLRYFAIKDCLETGCSDDSVAAKDYLPYGYTALLLFLSKLGILKSFTIVLINCIYLFSSVYFLLKFFGKSLHPQLFIIFLLLNWTVIKFTTHPLSEMQFLFFSTGSIYFFSKYTDTKKIYFLLPAFLCSGFAFITRTVGITLVAALIVALIWQYRKELLLLIKKHKFIAGFISLAAICTLAFSKQLGLDHYTGVLTKQFTEGVGFGDILKWHFTEWAEISFNTSISKISDILPFGMAKPLFLIAGIIFFSGFLFFLFKRKNNFPVIIKVYVILYSLLMFNWPFYDPRFWIPITPIVVAVLVQVITQAGKPGLTKIIFYPLLTAYILMGVISVGFLTYTSLDKNVFAKTQANGVYRNEYEKYFFGKPISDTTKKINPDILSVLERHNR